MQFRFDKRTGVLAELYAFGLTYNHPPELLTMLVSDNEVVMRSE